MHVRTATDEGDEAVTSPQMGREMAAARVDELLRAAERQRTARDAATAARHEQVPATPAHPSRWLVRLVGATLRH